MYAGFERDNVILLTTDQQDMGKKPLRNVILGALKALRNFADKDSTILFAFTGHGVEHNGRGVLLPADALLEDIEETAIPISRVRELLEQTGAARVILVIDAFRNEVGGGQRGVGERNLLTHNFVDSSTRQPAAASEAAEVSPADASPGQAVAILYAASPGQSSWEDGSKRQGYFTQALVEGLGGAAASQDRNVQLGDLINYVERRVPFLAKGNGRRQNPFAIVEGQTAYDFLVSPSKPPVLRLMVPRISQTIAAA